ncbi:DUF6668 family protein [Streptomyces griseoviridis]|uniref:DUF6668 family protein n=1 Tax=Streptomyces griseoviridis TaxID=45398 RepID=UPI0033E12188
MGVPPPASGDRQMWVRGPTAGQAPAPAPTAPAADTVAQPTPAVQAAPTVQAAPFAQAPQVAQAPPVAPAPAAPAQGAPTGYAAPVTHQAQPPFAQPAPAVQAPTAVQATPVAQAAPAAYAAPAGYAPQAAPGPYVPQAAQPAPATTAAPGDWSLPAEPVEWAHQGDQGQHVSWVNAHGGAGASTLAREFGGTDLGRRWPDPARGEPGRVLLVARTHAAGMRAASRALDALRKEDHPPGIDLVALVLVADAPGRLPITLGRRVRVLRSATRVHRLPWVPAWRVGKKVSGPPRAVRALSDLVEGKKR